MTPYSGSMTKVAPKIVTGPPPERIALTPGRRVLFLTKDSELIRRGLRLVQKDLGDLQTALDVAGRSAGKFGRGPRDLSTHPKHLEGFGR